jgi:outer membrane protein assembly factor BamB
MPRDQRSFAYVGIKHCVVALDRETGNEMWRTDLHSSDYVTVFWDGTGLFAANSGEVWRLDPQTGATIWHNQMKGLGRGLVSLASSSATSTVGNTEMAESKRRRDAAAAASAGS